MTPALAAILAELDVVVIPTTKRREPGETCAVGTLERVLATRGAAHLREVLMSVMETVNNRRELTAPVIWALSDILMAHPSWFCGSRWFDVIDKIDLPGIRAKSKAMRSVAQPRQAIATMLLERLQRHFAPEPQMTLFDTQGGLL